jgi:hypothetical protein
MTYDGRQVIEELRMAFWLACLITKSFNNISAISWWSVLLVEETRVPRENHPPATSHWQTLLHNVVSSTPRHELDSNWQCEWIGTESIDSCISKYHTISTTTALVWPLSKNDITHKTFSDTGSVARWS